MEDYELVFRRDAHQLILLRHFDLPLDGLAQCDLPKKHNLNPDPSMAVPWAYGHPYRTWLHNTRPLYLTDGPSRRIRHA